MMHHKAIRTLGNISVRTISAGVLGGALAVACAGGDTPARDDALEAAIAQAYANGVGVAGSGPAPSGGSGGGAPAGGAGGAGGGSSSTSGAGGGGPSPGGTTGEGGEAGSGGGECDGFMLLQMKCSGPVCHSGQGSLSAFAQDLATAESYIGQESAMCPGAGDLFDPANPSASLVIEKVDGSSTCGGRMPLGPELLTDEEVACLEEWIGTL